MEQKTDASINILAWISLILKSSKPSFSILGIRDRIVIEKVSRAIESAAVRAKSIKSIIVVSVFTISVAKSFSVRDWLPAKIAESLVHEIIVRV